MRPALVVMALSLVAACMTDSDVTSALNNYCAGDETRACGARADCCPGFVCLSGACHHVSAGTCLFPDAGAQAAGADCGCPADCGSGQCGTDFVCQ